LAFCHVGLKKRHKLPFPIQAKFVAERFFAFMNKAIHGVKYMVVNILSFHYCIQNKDFAGQKQA
jgi:hypothetical protein